MTLTTTVELFLVSLATAMTALLFLLWLSRLSATRPASIFHDTSDQTVFLFDGETLIDSTPSGRALLLALPQRGSVWQRLVAHLDRHFTGVEEQVAQVAETGSIWLATDDDAASPLVLEAEMRGGLLRITLSDPSAPATGTTRAPLAQRAMQDELKALREIAAKSPSLIWREDDAANVVWANAAYMLTAGRLLPPGQDLVWPLPRIFGRLAAAQGIAGQRQSLAIPGQQESWFDLACIPNEAGRLVFATPCDAAVQAENSLRDFMQTLTKTFAQLPIGLAIFDHQRNLQLFNPALLDLTGLRVDFLSVRPSMTAFLDALRDGSMIPEPKDYRDWRNQIVSMERAAASGHYEEVWNLPDGQTFKVVGRPHPNGALALMFEDISSETLRTRRYRDDLELGQAVVDAIGSAIAVFSPSGQLVMTNAAYSGLWGHDPGESLTETGLHGLIDVWRKQTAPSQLWAEIEEFSATVGDRQIWSAEARLLDGRLLDCKIAPLAGGATMVSFTATAAKPASRPRLTKAVQRQSA